MKKLRNRDIYRYILLFISVRKNTANKRRQYIDGICSSVFRWTFTKLERGTEVERLLSSFTSYPPKRTSDGVPVYQKLKGVRVGTTGICGGRAFHSLAPRP